MTRPPFFPRALLLVLSLAAVVRAAAWLETRSTPDRPVVDAEFHHYWAKAWATGDWTPPPPHEDPDLRDEAPPRPPGYPMLLSAVYRVSGTGPDAPIALNLLCGLASVFLTFRLAQRWFGSAAAWWPATVLAVSWQVVYFEQLRHAPALTMLLGLAFLERWTASTRPATRWVAGLLLGASLLVRPTTAVFAVVALAWAAARARSWRAAGSAALPLALGAACIVTPWFVRNVVVADAWVPVSANLGLNLRIGHHDAAEGFVVDQLPPYGRYATCFDGPALRRAYAGVHDTDVPSQADVSRLLGREAFAWMLEHPGRTAALAAKRAILFVGAGEVAHNTELALDRQASAILRWLPGSFLWLFAAAVAGAMTQRRSMAWWLLALVGLWIAAHLPFFVATRYRMAVVPFLALASTPFAARCLEAWRTRQGRPLVVPGLVLVGIGVLGTVGSPCPPPDLGKWHARHGQIALERNELDRAKEHFTAAAAASPPAPIALGCLARFAVESRRWEDADRLSRRALALDATCLPALEASGWVALQRGQFQRALDAFVAVRQTAPSPRMDLALGLSALALEQWPDAARWLDLVIRHADDDASVREARFQRAVCAVHLGDAADAVPVLRSVATSEPQRTTAHYYLAMALRDTGDVDAARRSLETALSLRPGWEPAIELARSLGMEGETGDRPR